MKKGLIFIVGITAGILATILVNSYFQNNNYAILNKDYAIPNGGLLKKEQRSNVMARFQKGLLNINCILIYQIGQRMN